MPDQARPQLACVILLLMLAVGLGVELWPARGTVTSALVPAAPLTVWALPSGVTPALAIDSTVESAVAPPGPAPRARVPRAPAVAATLWAWTEQPGWSVAAAPMARVAAAPPVEHLAARPVTIAYSPALVDAETPEVVDDGHGAVTTAFIVTGRSMSSAFRAVGRSFQRVF